MHARALAYDRLVGVGGIGTGVLFALDENRGLGRNESRAGRLLDARDYCKLHIICHYVARLLAGGRGRSRFHVLPVGKVGADGRGPRLKRELTEAGADVSHITVAENASTLMSVCFQFPDGSGGNITANNSAASVLSEADVLQCQGLLDEAARRAIALAVPEVPLPVRDFLLRLASRSGALRVATFTAEEIASNREPSLFANLDLVALNKDEAAALIGVPFDTYAVEESLDRCRAILRAAQPHLKIVITVGSRGAYGLSDSTWDFAGAPAVPVASTAGAGDALLAGILAGLCRGLPLTRDSAGDAAFSALQLGVLLGSYSVTSLHTIHPDIAPATVISFAEAQDMECADQVKLLFQYETA